jgi:hypothetical protein
MKPDNEALPRCAGRDWLGCVLTRVEIGHIPIGSAQNGLIRSSAVRLAGDLNTDNATLDELPENIKSEMSAPASVQSDQTQRR